MKEHTEKRAPRLRITKEIKRLIALALKEDIGSGDVTSIATVPERQKGEGIVLAKEGGVLCGLGVARYIMQLVDRRVKMNVMCADGTVLSVGQDIARFEGPLRSILAAERVILNFLQRLSGIATLTRSYVDALRKAGSPMAVADTRKTTPLWRALERYAVRVGGGVNHRSGLYDMYLVKNNHADVAGGVGEALRRVWAHNKNRKMAVAAEARTLAEVREIVQEGANLILLDNMPPLLLRQAAQIIGRRAKTEITGGVRLAHVPLVARLPIDRVSIGSLTHSAPALDIALHVRFEGLGRG